MNNTNEFDLIVGTHSIVHALKNEDRKHIEIIGTESSLKELESKNRIKIDIPKKILKSHDLQEEFKKDCKELGFNYFKTSIFLKSRPLSFKSNAWLYNFVESSEASKFLVLDQVTDLGNAAAIARTCSFYGISGLIVSTKKSFSLTPKFFQIASGGYELLPFVQVPSLSKTINKLKTLGVKVIGFSEESTEATFSRSNKECFVLGAEDEGISNAVERSLDANICLSSNGPIKSLNVSVSAGIILEKFTT
jgi:23S rRNA (guanosine2251-2'-O)-methyltransferase